MSMRLSVVFNNRKEMTMAPRANEERSFAQETASNRDTGAHSEGRERLFEIQAFKIYEDLLDRRYRQGFLHGSLFLSVLSLPLWCELISTLDKWIGLLEAVKRSCGR